MNDSLINQVNNVNPADTKTCEAAAKNTNHKQGGRCKRDGLAGGVTHRPTSSP